MAITAAGFTTTFDTSGTTLSTNISWAAGDYVVVAALAEDNPTGFSWGTPAAAGLTFSAVDVDASTGSTHTPAATWSTLAAGAGTTVACSLTISSSSVVWGFLVFVVTGAVGGVGVHTNTFDTSETVSMSVSSGSAVVGIVGDWGAGATTGYAFVPAGGTAVGTPFQEGTHYTYYGGYWTGQTGTSSYGVNVTSSGSQYAKAFVELKATGGGGGAAVDANQAGGSGFYFPAWRQSLYLGR